MKYRSGVSRAFLAGLALVCSGTSLAAQGSGGISVSATGTVSTYARLSWLESVSDGLSGTPSAEAAVQSVALLSAETPSFLFRLRLAAKARADKASVLDSTDYSNALCLDVREAETAFKLSDSLALRGGLLLRNFGVGSYGSPANPFARDVDQGGFWGLNAEWTPSPTLSVLAIVSGDRAVRSGSLGGIEDFDTGALARLSPGILDAALGVYASGAGDGEIRPVASFSVPVAALLASLEAAASFPLSGDDRKSSQSLRFELRKSLALGSLSLEIGGAYRGVFPGRSAAEIAQLAAALPADGLPSQPFAPFYGRNYAEFLLYAEKADSFAFTAQAAVQLPWDSLSADARVDIYIGDASLFFRVQAIEGSADGEFAALARAAGLPLLVAWAGVEFSF